MRHMIDPPNASRTIGCIAWNSPVFWNKVQGHKYPGRWEIVERKIPSVKMSFKTNTNGHKHPSISLFIIEQGTIGETKENNMWYSTRELRTPPKTVL